MLPIVNINLSYDEWIDSLNSEQTLLLMKHILKKSGTLKKYYDDSKEKEREKRKKREKDLGIDINDINDINNINNIIESSRKRTRLNCGSSQCEMRFNGCNHSP